MVLPRSGNLQVIVEEHLWLDKLLLGEGDWARCGVNCKIEERDTNLESFFKLFEIKVVDFAHLIEI